MLHVSNELVKFSLKVIRLCIKMQISVAIENPLSSMLWSLPELSQLSARGGAKIKTDFCCWGEAWRKSTRVWFWNTDLTLGAKRCSGRGLCSRTKKPHTALSGLDPHGFFCTKKAQEYPLRWTSQLADIF